MEALLREDGDAPEADIRPISAALIQRRMAAVLEDRFDSREFRLSESGGCPRRRVAKALGIAGEEFDEATARYFERGHIVEAWVVDLFRAEYPRRCRTDVQVHTPTGETGHIDLTFPAERCLFEVKSVSAGAKELPRPEHVRQVQSYLHFALDAAGRRRFDRAELVYAKWGAGIETESIPVAYDPAAGRDIERELVELHAYRDRGTLPPIPAGHKPESYPCSWRNRAGRVQCSHWSLCWANIAVVPPLDAPEVAEDVARLAELEGKVCNYRQTVEDLEGARDLLRRRLGVVLSTHGAASLTAGGYLVLRTPVKGRESYDMASALTAGAVKAKTLAPFLRVGAGYDRWTVRRVKTETPVATAAG